MGPGPSSWVENLALMGQYHEKITPNDKKNINQQYFMLSDPRSK
jgi:hypothetical protein